MRKIEEIKVKEIMTYGAITIPEDANVIEAVCVLVEGNVDAVVVVNQKHDPVGVVSRADISKAFGRDFEEVKVTEIMYSPPEVIEMDKTIKYACELMKNKRIHRLIVIDENKIMRGVLSLTDVVREIYKIFRGH